MVGGKGSPISGVVLDGFSQKQIIPNTLHRTPTEKCRFATRALVVRQRVRYSLSTSSNGGDGEDGMVVVDRRVLRMDQGQAMEILADSRCEHGSETP